MLDRLRALTTDNVIPERIARLQKLRDPKWLHFSGLILDDKNPQRLNKDFSENEQVLIKKAGVYEEDEGVYLIKISLDTVTFKGNTLKFTVKPGITQIGDKQRLMVYGLAMSYCVAKPDNFPVFEFDWEDSEVAETYKDEFRLFLRQVYEQPKHLDLVNAMIDIFEDPEPLFK